MSDSFLFWLEKEVYETQTYYFEEVDRFVEDGVEESTARLWIRRLIHFHTVFVESKPGYDSEGAG